MNVGELISPDIFPLKKTDTCATALVFMQDWNVWHLPVAENGQLLGYVSGAKLADLQGNIKIEKHIEPLMQLQLHKEQHLFDVISFFAETKFSAIAVCNDQLDIEGIVSLKEIMETFRKSSLMQGGAIISLRMNPQDYSLAELSRIIEYNDCKILNVFIHPFSADVSQIIVTFKLNKQTVNTVVQTLERYQYKIHAVYNADESEAGLNNRYDWLIKYLNT